MCLKRRKLSYIHKKDRKYQTHFRMNFPSINTKAMGKKSLKLQTNDNQTKVQKQKNQGSEKFSYNE